MAKSYENKKIAMKKAKQEFRFVRRSNSSQILSPEVIQVRKQKVESLKKQIAEGSYRLTSDEIVKALLT
jgi:anti-sigma28 factor (negative regulator of flagellin synthesis)